MAKQGFWPLCQNSIAAQKWVDGLILCWFLVAHNMYSTKQKKKQGCHQMIMQTPFWWLQHGIMTIYLNHHFQIKSTQYLYVMPLTMTDDPNTIFHTKRQHDHKKINANATDDTNTIFAVIQQCWLDTMSMSWKKTIFDDITEDKGKKEDDSTKRQGGYHFFCINVIPMQQTMWTPFFVIMQQGWHNAIPTRGKWSF